ncbi:non-lysosomal glucosylceramidase [Echinicola sediminis]
MLLLNKKISLVVAFLIGLCTLGKGQHHYTGMPVGGLAAGQVYLGEDGQLWYWDIFNVARIHPGGPGDRYFLNPLKPDQFFDNGFGIKIKSMGREYVRNINATGFNEIEFTGEYPVGKVSYKDEILPVDIALTSYSPFIPTNFDDSGLPLIVMEYEVKNTSDHEVEIGMYGWLENMVGKVNTGDSKGELVNYSRKNESLVSVFLSGDYGEDLPDGGNMNLAVLGDGVAIPNAKMIKGFPVYSEGKAEESAQVSNTEKLVGAVKQEFTLQAQESRKVKFLLSWYFPNVHLWDWRHHWMDIENLRHYYSKQFDDAHEVAQYLVENPRLEDQTRQWNETWYDASLPKWFLDRTFANVSTLATTATVRFTDLSDSKLQDGRLYTYEGVYLGEGTCTHVFHYEQALGRVFPNMARQLREQTDLGISFNEKDGVIGYRGEFSKSGHHEGRGFAVDGQAGTILRMYREHLSHNSTDFVTHNWTKIKKSIEALMEKDMDSKGRFDGVLEGSQYNTLDRIWYGKIPWMSGLYLATLRAGEEMALVAGDKRFARKCKEVYKKGYTTMPKELFNGEYYIQELDANHLDAPNSNVGSHIDQLLGQYWASQLGLGEIVPENTIEASLKSIMKYNFVEDYGNYLDTASIPVQRYYGDRDDKGLVMVAFPKGGSEIAPGKINNDWEKLVVGYFSEFWTGQEHQLAATLIHFGMVEEGMKVLKAIEDRYSAEKRNPYNEVEYGNHYTRAMSGYAPFVAATGFYYNGPQKEIKFDPKINANDFSAAFITGGSWGTFRQHLSNGADKFSLEVKYGQLSLDHISVGSKAGGTAKVMLNGEEITGVRNSTSSDGLSLSFSETITLSENDTLEIKL